MAQHSPLAGTWKLVAYEQWSQGAAAYPMGRDAQGYIAYDPCGWMSVQIMRAGRPSPAADGYLAYAGSYEVDEAQATVTHHIALHLQPNAIGSHLVRRFAVHGSRLTLFTSPTVSDPPEGGRLTWERIP